MGIGIAIEKSQPVVNLWKSSKVRFGVLQRPGSVEPLVSMVFQKRIAAVRVSGDSQGNCKLSCRTVSKNSFPGNRTQEKSQNSPVRDKNTKSAYRGSRFFWAVRGRLPPSGDRWLRVKRIWCCWFLKPFGVRYAR
jgi:hypothetical protein